MAVNRGKRPTDPNQLAKWIIDQSTVGDVAPAPKPTIPKNLSAYMASMGRKGGMVGGKRRLETMTPQQRRAAAQKAAQARWKKPTGG
jgi:hypothetical protein